MHKPKVIISEDRDNIVEIHRVSQSLFWLIVECKKMQNFKLKLKNKNKPIYSEKFLYGAEIPYIINPTKIHHLFKTQRKKETVESCQL